MTRTSLKLAVHMVHLNRDNTNNDISTVGVKMLRLFISGLALLCLSLVPALVSASTINVEYKFSAGPGTCEFIDYGDGNGPIIYSECEPWMNLGPTETQIFTISFSYQGNPSYLIIEDLPDFQCSGLWCQWAEYIPSTGEFFSGVFGAGGEGQELYLSPTSASAFEFWELDSPFKMWQRDFDVNMISYTTSLNVVPLPASGLLLISLLGGLGIFRRFRT